MLNKDINSIEFDDRVLAASTLATLGKLGQRLYKICPEGEQKEELAKNILKIKGIIEKL
jgi:hypothetical protein